MAIFWLQGLASIWAHLWMVEKCESTTITTTRSTTTTPDILSPLHPVFAPPTEPPVPLCSDGITNNCFLPGPTAMPWDSAHQFCRSRDGFLIAKEHQLKSVGSYWPPHNLTVEDADSSFRRRNLSAQDLTWTALMRHNGHYQWLSQFPDYAPAIGQFVAWSPPNKCSQECAGHDVLSQRTYFISCCQSLRFFCHLPEASTWRGEIDPSDVELRVTVNRESANGWVEVSEADFPKLVIDCTAFHTITGRPLGVQPSVFWSKDGVYIDSQVKKLLPATFYDASKYDVPYKGSEASHPELKQGTYWCESWVPSSPSRFVSNKVLVTLTEWTVLIVDAKREEPFRTDCPDDPAGSIRETLKPVLRNIDNYSVDMINVQNNVSIDRTTMFVSYKFHVHVPMSDNCLDHILDIMKDDGEGYKKLYENKGYLGTSSIYFGTYCTEQRVKYLYGNTLVWPFSRAGRVSPKHYRCRGTNNELNYGYCKWNYTHGASIEFDPSECQDFDSCPLGYTKIADYLCMFISKPDTWHNSLKEIYKTANAIGILDILDSFHINESSNSNSVYGFVKQLSVEKMESSVIWLPIGRVIDNGPLEYFGPGQMIYPYKDYKQPEFYRISWEPDQPASNQTCLALNLMTNTLLTLDCNTELPYVNFLNVSGLLELPTYKWKSIIPQLIAKDPGCPEDWFSSGFYNEMSICFKLFTNIENTTWERARNFCELGGAQLPTPGKGFLDWVFRQHISDHNVASVWMAEESAYGNGHMDFVNWKASTDHSLMYGSLGIDGWEREPGDAVKSDILCQRENSLKTDQRMSLHVVKRKRKSKSQGFKVDKSISTVCLELTSISEDESRDIKCYANGMLVPVKKAYSRSCTHAIESLQGYYQCYLWVKNPAILIESNEVLNLASDVLTFAVTLVQVDSYSPEKHDSTFIYGTNFDYTTNCATSFIDYIESQISNIIVSVKNFFYTPGQKNFTLFHNFNVEMKARNRAYALISEYDMLVQLVPLFRQDRNFSGCELASVQSTVGCLGEVTKVYGTSERNLTWPTVRGHKAVLPKELCINERAEPVYRECVGNFLQGYHWGEISDGCTGDPTNVTKTLWNVSRSESSGDLKTLSNLISDGSALLPADIHFVAKKFQQISKKDAVPSKMGLEDVVEMLNNVMEADEEAFEVLQHTLNTSGILFEAFRNITFKIKMPPANGDKIVKAARKLISVERLDLQVNSSVIGYQSLDGGKRQVTIRKDYDESSIKGDAAIIFPENLTYIVANMESENETEKVKLTFAVYRTPKLFQDHASFPNYSVSGDILQATYDGKVVKDLDEPVQILFRRSDKGNDSICVFWDFRKNLGLGGWSTDGCWRGDQMGDYDICLCNHLTCFAQLINYDDEEFEGIHAIALDIITVIGCSLSIIGLLMVFATFCLFKKWRRSLSNKILVNLSISVFCSIVIFLAGINQTWNTILCRSVAVSLHYFILASFGWMLVEAVHQYLKFVKVVGTYIPRFLWKASVSAWGLPVLPIIVVLVYDSTLYDNKGSDEVEGKICWMSSECFIYAMLPPLALTMLVNIIMFVLIIRGAVWGRARMNSTLSERSLFMSQLSMAVCVFFLLGFTWIFGLLSIWKGRLLFSYLFCIFNTLQGFFIFLFHLCRERTARRLWKDFLSVISRVPVSTSDPVHSNNILSVQRTYRLENVTYNQGGGILVLPRRVSADTVRTTSTLANSRASFRP
ncbi:uncharacterized protein [Macrobrachium rosenbergii]|uniref:uncharacterized protein isoform X1 n=1 Tax=Macrobrachium rosenbergii TaxID=79674 RepID=UPI0034D5626B